MTTEYLLPCECGREICIVAGQAGQDITCQCGQTFEVPPLRKLAQLDRVVKTKAATPAWGPAKRVGFVMSAITTRIILGVVFYGAILPFGFVFRVRGKDLMDRKWDHGIQSYRVASRAPSATHMEKPF